MFCWDSTIALSIRIREEEPSFSDIPCLLSCALPWAGKEAGNIREVTEWGTLQINEMGGEIEA